MPYDNTDRCRCRAACVSHVSVPMMRLGARAGAPMLRTSKYACVGLFARPLATSAPHHLEMATILDRFDPDPEIGMWKKWSSFTVSTLAVVQLRKELPEWSAINFKAEASNLWSDVGAAIAAGKADQLRKLTTPSCFATMSQSLKARPEGQRHRWETFGVEAKVRSVRIGHHASSPSRKFAQVTCSIDAKVVWTISDRKGQRVGGVGTSSLPHEVHDLVVFERCISDPVQPPSWRMKDKWRADAATDGEGLS